MNPSSRSRVVAFAAVIAALGAGSAFAADPPPADNAPVTRAEYEALKKELLETKQEIQQLRKERAANAGGAQAGPAASTDEITELRKEVSDLRKAREADVKEAEDERDQIMQIVKDVQNQANANAAGTTKLLITGDADVGFTAVRGHPSTFEAGFAPRFLWEINDKLYFDGALDIGFDDNGNTSVELMIASLNYIVNDYLTVGAGEFVAQFAAYHRYFDPSWINKLPDDPLVFSDGGLAPESVMGAYMSGAYPINRDMRINYAAYISNGAQIDFTNGSLDHGNRNDSNNNKAVGGRIGFVPIPQLEIGYSMQYGQVHPENFDPGTGPIDSPRVSAFLQAVDFNYVRPIDQIAGVLTLRAEWVFSHVGNTTAPGGDPILHDNDRNGGYAMIAYRPSMASNKILRNFEFIFRYDRLDIPGGQFADPTAPNGDSHEQRFTYGIDYWLNAQTVVKFAYECDEQAHLPGASAYLFQVGVGF